MHTHLRALALFFAVVFALSVGSCSRDDLFGWLTGDGKTEKRNPLAPDSTRGDTTFYSYTIRSLGSEPGVWTFATISGYWYAYNVVGIKNWLPVENSLQLACIRDDDALIAQAEEIIRQNGHEIVFRITRDGYGFEGYPGFKVNLTPDPPGQAEASLPLLQLIDTYDRRRDVFGWVWPTTGVEIWP